MAVGYVKLHRKLLEWEWKTKPLTTALFIHLMLSASFEVNHWRGITIKKGQLIAGRKKLAEKTGLTERQVRTALKHLKTTNEVTIISTKEYSIISMVNWNKYQASDQQKANERPTSDQRATTTKEGKEGKKVKNITIPDFINGDIWIDWIKHRKEIRKALTETQSLAIVKKLTNWHNEGININNVIQESISNGWTGLFKPKGKYNGKQTKGQRNDDELQRFLDRPRD